MFFFLADKVMFRGPGMEPHYFAWSFTPAMNVIRSEGILLRQGKKNYLAGCACHIQHLEGCWFVVESIVQLLLTRDSTRLEEVSIVLFLSLCVGSIHAVLVLWDSLTSGQNTQPCLLAGSKDLEM